MTVFILGAGPAGLAIVDALVDEGTYEFHLLERDDVLGGLARSLSWQNRGSHDLGPHKIFTLDQQLMRRVEALLPPTDWLTRDKVSSIYMKGHYLPYPPSPFSLIGVFGAAKFAQMVLGFGTAKLRGLMFAREAKTFEEDIVARVGNGLYQALFRPIAIKLWGDPCHLDVKLSRGRVQTPSIFEVIGRLIGLKQKSEFEALTFRYPKGGLGKIWEAIADKAKDKGKFDLGCNVSGLLVKDGVIQAIRVLDRATGAERSIPIRPDDFVVSTLPVGLLLSFLEKQFSSDTVAKARASIVLNDLLLVFLHVDTPNLIKESWVFVPDPEISFHRLSEQESFDAGMTPEGSIVCCEIMGNSERPMSAKTDRELIDLSLQGLAQMGYTGFNVNAQKVIRLPRSYPVFKPGYEENLKEILAEIDSIANLRTIGRQGSFNYVGTIDAMDMGYGFARWFFDRKQTSWSDERIRTSHYPVLD